jgi:hypothetical protein
MSNDYSMYDAVVYYDDEYKSLLLGDAEIDKGIRELCDAINSSDFFVTMNSCQGFLVVNEKSEHCPCAYVDFFVLYDFYNMAESLFILLIEKFRSFIICSMEYQADFDIIDDPKGDIAADNGQVILRYHIEFVELLDNLHLSTYREVVDCVNEFSYHENEEYRLFKLKCIEASQSKANVNKELVRECQLDK